MLKIKIRKNGYFNNSEYCVAQDSEKRINYASYNCFTKFILKLNYFFHFMFN